MGHAHIRKIALLLWRSMTSQPLTSARSFSGDLFPALLGAECCCIRWISIPETVPWEKSNISLATCWLEILLSAEGQKNKYRWWCNAGTRNVGGFYAGLPSIGPSLGPRMDLATDTDMQLSFICWDLGLLFFLLGGTCGGNVLEVWNWKQIPLKKAH